MREPLTNLSISNPYQNYESFSPRATGILVVGSFDFYVIDWPRDAMTFSSEAAGIQRMAYPKYRKSWHHSSIGPTTGILTVQI
jgi:hypothetical protein